MAAKKKKSKSTADGAVRMIAENRKARHSYELIERLEAGLVLTGSEVKSLRAGNASIGEAFIKFEAGEAWLIDSHISPYPQAGPHNNHEPRRPRKLLMDGRQIYRWTRKTHERGLAAVPLKLYFQGAWAKVEIALGRGRQRHDKRAAIKEQEGKREAARALRGERD